MSHSPVLVSAIWALALVVVVAIVCGTVLTINRRNSRDRMG